MTITLREALEETMSGWRKAVPEPWRPVFRTVKLGADEIPVWLKHSPWVPIFPVFKNQATGEILQATPPLDKGANLVGLPRDAHTFRALLVPPESVKVVIVGQDPYPDITDATGQSFEQGSISNWVQDAHRVAGSLKPILQTAAAEVTGNEQYRIPWQGWQHLVEDIDNETVRLAAPAKLFSAYQKQGMLWLNTTLSISHFRVYPRGKPSRTTGKPLGYQEAHAAYWKPFITRLFEHLVTRESGTPVVFGLFGGWAKSFKAEIRQAAEAAGNLDAVRFVEAGHPVTKPFIERDENPFTEINEKLQDLGQRKIKWLPRS